MSAFKKIKKLPLFANFKRGELEEIIDNSFIKTLFADENLFVKNEKRDIFFIVLSGEIDIVRKLGEISRTVEVVKRGEYIAEYTLFNPQSIHKHTAITRSKQAIVLGLPGKLFLKLSINTRYKLLLNLLPIVSNKFSHASNRIMTILQIGQLLSTKNSNVQSLGKGIINTLLVAIQAEKGLIVITSPGSPPQVKVRATAGFKNNDDIVNQTILLSQDHILNSIIKGGKTLNISQAKLSKKCIPYVNSSLLGMPLQFFNKNIGAIVLIDKKDQQNFNTNNEVLLNIIAQMTSWAIYQAEQNEFQEAQQELARKYIGI